MSTVLRKMTVGNMKSERVCVRESENVCLFDTGAIHTHTHTQLQPTTTHSHLHGHTPKWQALTRALFRNMYVQYYRHTHIHF